MLEWLDWGHTYLVVACVFAADVASVPENALRRVERRWSAPAWSAIAGLIWPIILVVIIAVLAKNAGPRK